MRNWTRSWSIVHPHLLNKFGKTNLGRRAHELSTDSIHVCVISLHFLHNESACLSSLCQCGWSAEFHFMLAWGQLREPATTHCAHITNSEGIHIFKSVLSRTLLMTQAGHRPQTRRPHHMRSRQQKMEVSSGAPSASKKV